MQDPFRLWLPMINLSLLQIIHTGLSPQEVAVTVLVTSRCCDKHLTKATRGRLLGPTFQGYMSAMEAGAFRRQGLGASGHAASSAKR